MKILKENGTIGIISPGFYADSAKLERGIHYLEKQGFTVKRGKSLSERAGYLSGDDELRAADINNMFADNSVDMIICSRGGWGSLRLLDKLDYMLIGSNRKLIAGYSDITSLQLALWKQLALPSLSGPMAAVEMADEITPYTEQYFWEQALNKQRSYHFKLDELGAKALIRGKANGILVGGCLSMISAQLATPYSPDYNGTVLFMEDINEPLYKIDRQLAQLRLAGVLDKLAAVIIGNFIGHEADDNALEALFTEYFSGRGYPVIMNFPYGHAAKKISLPIGASCRIDTESGILEINSCYENL